MLAPLLALLSCTPAPAGDSALSTTPHTWEPEVVEHPPLSAADAEAGMAAAVRQLVAVDPTALHALYEGLVGLGDASCPWRSDLYVDQDYWEDDCAAADGSVFHGWALSLYWRERELRFEHLLMHELGWFNAFARLVTPEGHTFEGWGLAYTEVRESTDAPVSGLLVDLGGTFTWDGPGSGSSWLSQGLGLTYTLESERTPEGRTVRIEGGISRMTGPFDAFVLRDFALDSSVCAIEPTGTFSLHEAATGRWLHVAFPGEDPCDGCGAVRVDLEPVAGEACLDVSPLIDWERAPWE